MRIAITGHRYWKNDIKVRKHFEDRLDFSLFIITKFVKRKDLIILHGAAEGIDLLFGEFALKYNLTTEIHLPFPQEIQLLRSKMPLEYREMLNTQCKKASNVIIINKTFSTYGYQKRNMSLVDNADLLFTYYTRNRSGSGNCKRYAEDQKLPIWDLRKGNFRNLRDLVQSLKKGEE